MDHSFGTATGTLLAKRGRCLMVKRARMAGWGIVAAVLALAGYLILWDSPETGTADGAYPSPAGGATSHGGNTRRSSAGTSARYSPAKAAPLDRWSALEGLFAEWERSGYFMDRDLEKLFRDWFAAKPGEALEAITKMKDMGRMAAGYHPGAILKWGVDAFANDPQPLWNKAEAMLGRDGPDMLSFQRHLMSALGLQNPVAGLELLKQVPNSRSEYLLGILCAAWGRDEPRSALRVLATFGSPSESTLTERVRNLTVGSMGFEDLAWARKEGMPEAFLSKIRSAAYYREVEEGRMDELIARVATEPPESRESRNTHPLVLAAAGERPEDFLASMKRLQEVGAFVPERDAARVGHLLVQWRAEAARRFFDALADCPAAQASVADSISHYHLQNDANRCAAWITSLPPGSARNAALQPLLAYLRKNAETESLQQWEQLLSK